MYPTQKTTSAALGKAQCYFRKRLMRGKLEEVPLQSNLLAFIIIVLLILVMSVERQLLTIPSNSSRSSSGFE